MPRRNAVATTLPKAMEEEFKGMEGDGFEAADADAFAIPFIRILQTNSPQVNSDEEAYIKGAKAGMFFNTITGDLYGKAINVVPVSYQRDFVEWKPNRGGFVRSHGGDVHILDRIADVDEKNNSILDNGNVIQDTKNHFILLVDRLDDGPIILSLVSTGIKHSRRWMSNMRRLKTPQENSAPMFSSVYKITTVLNKNEEGNWYQVGDKNTTAIERAGWVNAFQWEAAKAAKELIDSGRGKAAYEEAEDEVF